MPIKRAINAPASPSEPIDEKDILTAMVKHSPTNTSSPLSLWEQWLQKLSVSSWLSPVGERNKLAVVDWILGQYQPSRHFAIRLADRLTTALSAQSTVLYQRDGGKVRIIHSRLPKTVEHELLKLAFLHKASSDHSQSIIQHTVELNLGTTDEPILTVAIVDVPLAVTESSTGLLLLIGEPLGRNDQKFIRLVHRAIKGRQHQLYLVGALAAGNERLTTLIHHLSEGMVILNKDLQIVQWNRPMQRFTGYSPREAESKPYQQVFQRNDSPNWLHELMIEYQTTPLRNVFFAEFEIKTKPRRSCWVSISGSFLRNAENQIEQTIIIVRDISRHKQLEQRKNDFISIATHELRTPITAIKGYLSLIERDTAGLNAKQVLYVSRAREANDRLVRLAEDLLQVIQVEENRLRFTLRPINLLPITRKVVSDFSPLAAKKGLEIALATPDFPTTIAADPVRIEQVIANLVDNAVKYTVSGKVELGFSQSVDQDMREPQIVMFVRDTGIGINERDLSHIFDKFHRCANASPNPQSGAGLGLFIVRSFVEKQHGQISVKSRPGRGTTFTLTFAAVESNAVSKKTVITSNLKRREKHGKKASSAR